MKKKSNPYEAFIESLFLIMDSEYEGSDVSEEEVELAFRRFVSSFRYIIRDEIQEERCEAGSVVSRSDA